MSVVYTDLIDGDAATYTRRGWENISRSALVSGISPSISGHAKIMQAFNILELDIGMQHPSFDNNYIRSISPTSIASDTVTFLIQYEQMTGFADEISGGGGLIQIETNLDRNGKAIVLEYTYPDDYAIDIKYAGQTDKVSKLIAVDKSVVPLSIKRRQIFSAIQKPQQLAESYVGKVNSDNWSVAFDGATRRWKCTGIDFNYVLPIFNSGKQYVYDMTYQFQYNSNAWNESLIYVDPNTGNPPEDAEADEFEVLDQIAFNSLIDSIIT